MTKIKAKPKTRAVLLNLDAALVKQVDSERRALGVTRKAYIQHCIEQYLKENGTK